MRYYSFIVVIVIITMAILSILVHENNRFDRKTKRLYYEVYIIVALSAIFEWLGVYLSGNMDYPAWILQAVKCGDYILTPFACVALLIQLRHNKKFVGTVFAILTFNMVLQLVTVITGGMITIDSHNHYTHGPLYPIYMAMYFILIILIIIGFIQYGRNFRRQNKVSLYAIMTFIIAGILMQELTESYIRTAYLVIAIGLALLYIHVSELAQVKTDDELKLKNYEIMESQIKPHFLFNVLSVIREIYQDDVDEGDEALVEFSQYLRYNLDILGKEDMVDFASEMENVERYLDMQKMRFGDTLKTSFDLQCKDFKVPSLSIQPIVENAVNHGVRKKLYGPGLVTIRSREFDDHYEIQIVDNGPGFDPNNIKHDDDKTHIGLENVRERLRIAGKGELKIDSVIGEGTTATLIIPKGDKA